MDKNTPVPTDPTAMKHVRYLAEKIGPRGSTTPAEAQAAGYARQVMEEAGLQPVVETFTSARSAWWPYALATGMALVAEILFIASGRVGALLAFVLTVIALACVFLELTFQDNPLRWVLPKGQSQNAWARLPAGGEVKRCVVLIGHLDTHRTPRMYSSPGWLRVLGLLMPVGLGAVTLNGLVFILSLLSGWKGWYSLSLFLALAVWWIFILALQADFTPYTHGANDNATGVGVVLSLAARLKEQPLPTTEVWALCSGCEEVGCYGAADFLARHGDELLVASVGGDKHPGRAYCIVLDTVGGPGTGPCYLSQETFLTTVKGDPELLRLADEVSGRRPELGAYRLSMSGAYTESSIVAQAGLRPLTFVNLRKDGTLPHWHQPADIVANVDGLVVQNTEAFVWELLWALDGGEPAAAAPQEPGPEDEGG